jgi:AcrR family transcriptional regulator
LTGISTIEIYILLGMGVHHGEGVVMTTTDRRIQRTRALLQQALIQLMGERGFDTITIQDIVERANVGRTTFYLHYGSKDDLFMSCHETMLSEAHFGRLFPLSKEELLAPETPAGLASAYHHLENSHGMLDSIFQSKDNLWILRRIRDWSAREIEAILHTNFSERNSTIPFEMLANYLAGAQIALLQWWLEKPRLHGSDTIAQTFHRLQRAAICDALGIQ